MDLLTTGVDVPCVRNIVFFKYVRSPIAFYQMVGRGTRIDPPTGKLMFRVYDYTDATRLFGEEFKSRFTPPRREPTDARTRHASPPPERTIQVEGFDVRVSDAGRYIVTMVDGRAMPVTVEEYKERLAERLVAEAPTLERFRARWIAPPERRDLLGRLPDAGRSALLVRALEDMTRLRPLRRAGRAGLSASPPAPASTAPRPSPTSTPPGWPACPPPGAATLSALARQFARAGTDGLENPEVFQTPEVARAGGIRALRALGQPADILRETKERLFAA